MPSVVRYNRRFGRLTNKVWRHRNIIKCKVRGCKEPPMYKFGYSKVIITCAEHADKYKQEYNRYSLITGDTPVKQRKAPRVKCEEGSCKEIATMIGRGDKMYCTQHGLPSFESTRMKPKMEAGERILEYMENVALGIVNAADAADSESG